eukprot:Hpha_TRINITY_DN15798_c2_g13::TRINITY_DN15798_c2_g13_i1::g.40480::m.40480
MPRSKFIDPKKASHYQLVYKSHEDPSYEDEKTAGVLMKSARVGKRRVRTGYEKNILNEEVKFNMHGEDDAAGLDLGLFDEEDEVDFGQDFIQQMMMPGEGEEDEEEELDDYPRHAPTRDIDQDFEGLLKGEYKAHQMEIEEEDPRAEGALPAEAYVPAMQELNTRQRLEKFALVTRGDAKRPDLQGGLRTTGEEVFHEDAQGGRFMTVLQSKKDVDILQDWDETEEESKRQALAIVRAANAKGYDIAARPDGEEYDEVGRDQYEYIRVRQKPQEKWDCQTLLTTLSTLENHPTVIPQESKRIKMRNGRPVVVDRTRLTAKALQRLGEDMPTDARSPSRPGETSEVGSQLKDLECVRRSGALSEEEFRVAKDRIIARSASAAQDDAEAEAAAFAELDDGESMVTVYDTSAGRPKNEDPEQKKMRKQAAKDEKRAKREQKKALKTAYKAETIKARYVAPKAKQQKAQLSL